MAHREHSRATLLSLCVATSALGANSGLRVEAARGEVLARKIEFPLLPTPSSIRLLHSSARTFDSTFSTLYALFAGSICAMRAHLSGNHSQHTQYNEHVLTIANSKVLCSRYFPDSIPRSPWPTLFV